MYNSVSDCGLQLCDSSCLTLHFLTPGDVVRAIERLDVMGVLLVFGGHGGVRDMGVKMEGERSGEKRRGMGGMGMEWSCCL